MGGLLSNIFQQNAPVIRKNGFKVWKYLKLNANPFKSERFLVSSFTTFKVITYHVFRSLQSNLNLLWENKMTESTRT